MATPQLTYPGVYINELPATGPIVGVGTSTPAFLGPALDGPFNVPVLITNWRQFVSHFGGFITGHYLANAVRGFYDNGGTVAYVVRVGTGATAELDLLDQGETPSPTIHVEAKQAGIAGNSYTVKVALSNLVKGTLVKNTATAIPAADVTKGNPVVTLTNATDATKFQAGDFITLNDSTTEHLQIVRVRAPQLFLAAGASTDYSSVSVRIADVQGLQTTLRVANGKGLQPGSVIRIGVSPAGGGPATTFETRVVNTAANFGDGSVAIQLDRGLTNTYSLKGTDPDITVTSQEFDLTFNNGAKDEATNTFLSMDTRHANYFVRAVKSDIVSVSQPLPPLTPSTQSPPTNQPAPTNAGTALSLKDGADDDINSIGLIQYMTALNAIQPLGDVNMVCVPDSISLSNTTMAAVQGAVRDHCENMGDRFAILDASLAASSSEDFTVVNTERANAESQKGYAAFYYPWLMVADPLTNGNDTILVPSSGHMAGIYARVDNERGVHKAPANELVRGALGLGHIVDDTEQGVLNLSGIDVLRVFPGQTRPTVWGARTTCPKDEVPWRYINVRRLFLFVEQSIKLGIRWAVFEPNDQTLWKKLTRVITEFLTRVWQSGALFGAKASEAFYVKIDEENNPEDLRAQGQVNIEIGLAPTKPAEFVIVQIGLWDGGSSVAES